MWNIHLFMYLQVSELNDKANEIMHLKFGRIVNIDALEGLTTNKMIGELEEILRQEERKHDIKMYMLEVRLFQYFHCYI